MSTLDVLLLIMFAVGLIGAGLYFLNRWASKRVGDQQDMIAKSKQTVSIYVIDKKKVKPAEANLPKVMMESLPKWYRFMKMPLVKAKIGAQIMTLVCDKKVFEAIPVKKNVKVDLAGIYIVELKGMRSDKEMKEKNNAEKKGIFNFFRKG